MLTVALRGKQARAGRKLHQEEGIQEVLQIGRLMNLRKIQMLLC